MNDNTDDAEGTSPAQAPNVPKKVTIRKLATGVRGLDEIMGGGIPEFSFNIIAGTPGCGKTTLAHQIMFANATPEKPVLYFTVLGEPAMKMLRYQQQFSFFNESVLDTNIEFINLGELVLKEKLGVVLEEIIRQVKSHAPGIVIVDSFRTVVRKAVATADELEMQAFVQNLAQFLTSWQATTFLVGEYHDEEVGDNPLFTVADGILWLYQVPERNSVVRKLQVFKLRGVESIPGLHTFKIGNSGLQTYPRTLGFSDAGRKTRGEKRLTTGVAELDAMLGGGIPQGDSVLIAGPSGTGKSAIASHFISQGLREGETAVIAVFEERPDGYAERASNISLDLRSFVKSGALEMLYLRPLDLSVDETMQEVLDAIARTKATRLVIDSLVGFEMALAPGFRTDFRESLYRMIVALTNAGVTIVSTVEVEDSFNSLALSQYAISFLTDDIIRLRYVEIERQLRRVLMVVKMRGSEHSKDIREYTISKDGLQIMGQESLLPYSGLTTGLPRKTGGES